MPAAFIDWGVKIQLILKTPQLTKTSFEWKGRKMQSPTMKSVLWKGRGQFPCILVDQETPDHTANQEGHGGQSLK